MKGVIGPSTISGCGLASLAGPVGIGSGIRVAPTGLGCVSRVYTDLAVIDVGQEGARVVDMVDGLGFDQLQAVTAIPLAR